MKTLDALPYLEWTEKDGSLQRFYADVVTDESGGMPATVTTFPVEKGQQITDNYRKDPETFRLRMLISGSPIRGDLDSENPGDPVQVKLKYRDFPPGAPLYTPGGLAQGLGNAITSVFGGGSKLIDSMSPLQFDDPPADRFQKLLDLVRRFQSEGLLITVKSTFGRWENMGILSAAPHKSPELGDGFELEIDATEVRFVSSETVIGEPLPAEPRGQPKKNGANAGSGTEVTGPKKTVAKGLADKFRTVKLF